MYALIDDLLRATKKWAEEQKTDTATIETSIAIFYRNGEAVIAGVVIPSCLEKHIDMAYDRL